MSKITRQILIAVEDEDFGKHLAKELKKELCEYDLIVVTNCEDARKSLYPAPQSRKSPFEWVIIDEHLTNQSEGSFEPYQTHASIALAKEWMSRTIRRAPKNNASVAGRGRQSPKRGCVVLTQSYWRSPPTRFSQRLLGALRRGATEELAVHLADMIDASNADQCYLEPLVFRLSLNPPTKDSEHWTLQFLDDVPHGPHAAKAAMPHDVKYKLSQQDFSVLGPTSNPTTPETYAGFNRITNSLGDELFGHPVMIEIDRKRREFKENFWEGDDPPPLVHLHIYCEENSLGFFLDAAIRPNSGENRLASTYPLVWKLAVEDDDPAHPGANTIRVHGKQNRVSSTGDGPMGYFAAATSCSQPSTSVSGNINDPIAGNVEHAKRLHKSLRWDKPRSPRELSSREDLRKFLKLGEGCRKRRYVLTHGEVHRKLPSFSGLMIGEQPITVRDIKKMLKNDRLGFFFVNCCNLAHQADAVVSQCDFFGGFVSGAITSGITTEAIGNRWKVVVNEAQSLAESFYKSHPRTLNARAAALFHAREFVRNNSASTNLSWLAPVHVIRQKLGGLDPT